MKIEQNPPSRVVRFYSNRDYALKCITSKKITYIHIDKLNDPFDLALDLATDFNNDYNSLIAYIQDHHPNNVNYFREKFPEQNWYDFKNDWPKKAKAQRSKIFLFSTCEVDDTKRHPHPCDNLYMWGHYGNGHRGIAIEFNTDVITKFMNKTDGKEINVWWKMIYKNEMLKIEAENLYEWVMNAKPDKIDLESYGPNLAENIRQQTHIKSKYWELEYEWRLVVEGNETKLKIYKRDLPDDAITKVYLGCRLEENKYKSVQKKFINKTRKNFPNAIVYLAKRKEGEFALIFEKIS